MLQLITFSTLNGVLYGMLLFMMASGLTLIFSMMGVLNFAHAGFYMLSDRCAARWLYKLATRLVCRRMPLARATFVRSRPGMRALSSVG